MSAELLADGDVQVLDDSDFFAPVAHDLIDSLLSQYQASRTRITDVAEFVAGEQAASVMHYFLEGNKSDGRYSLSLTAGQLFDQAGAIGALNASFWSKALQLTDVLDMMPQARRDKWNQQIRNPLGVKGRQWRHDWESDRPQEWESDPLPDFEEATVRDSLAILLGMRAQFLAERVDGIFRGLSGEHVTNVPEGFGKRMIISHVLNSYDNTNHSRTGLINDLRCVIAKFMGRDEPSYQASDYMVRSLKGRWGKWVELDGGALKVRLYMKGTAHLEVHPDMAWRLNMVLAHMHPAAIPASFRQKPKRKAKTFPLATRPLPFAVLAVLAEVKGAREKVKDANGTPTWPERYASVRNTVALGYTDKGKHVEAEVKDILRALGGTELHNGRWFEFDYDPTAVIQEIVNTGTIPDQRSHQFYPTPEKLAQRVVALAEILPRHACLEPSAGTGGLAAFLPADRTDCVEVSALHCKVLEAKGLRVWQGDFLAFQGQSAGYDRIVMNPPFDQGRWAAHVAHAASLVRVGGRLVAILPGSAKGTDLPGFKTDFHGPYSNEFPGTSVNVVILVADRI